MLTVGHNVLSTSDLEPYSGWESFRPRIEDASNVYNELASPEAISRVGLRYINRIHQAAVETNFSDYFRVEAPSPPGMEVSIRSFLTRSEARLPSGDILVLTFASSRLENGEDAFVLDLDVSREFESEPLVSLMRIVDELRTQEREAFENCITDRARELFDGIHN